MIRGIAFEVSAGTPRVRDGGIVLIRRMTLGLPARRRSLQRARR
jgi:hypothetical protein